MDNTVVSVRNLTKKFGEFTAVDAVSFEVAGGEIYGFLGANGAGKTTTIKMLCGLLMPTSGEGRIAGYDIIKDTERIKRSLGYMSQKFSLYGILTVEENLEFYAGIYGMKSADIKRRMELVISQTQLQEYRKRQVAALPGGLKQRVALACAFIHDPGIIFLDEPTAGVDPLLRRRFWRIIDELSAEGKTIFVTTHYMDEVEHCHRIALMDTGRIIKEGTIQEIKSSTFSAPVLEVETADSISSYKRLAESRGTLGEVSLHGAMVHVVLAGDKETAKKAISSALPGIKGIREIEPTMEDVFVKIVKG